MWRSQARAFLFRSSISRASSSSSTKTKVPSKTLTLVSCSSPHPSTWIHQTMQTITISQHLRFFSHSPEPIDSATDNYKETNNNGTEKNVIFGEHPSSTSQEAAAASSPISSVGSGENDAFDKNPESILSKSDVSSPIFRDEIEGEEGLGETPGFIFPESDDSPEKDGIFGENPSIVSEDLVDDIDRNDIEGGGDLKDGFIPEEAAEEMESKVPAVNKEQVENVLSVLQSSLDAPLESTLDELGLDLSEEFVVRVIQTPQVLGENLIGFFRWASKKPEFSVSSRVIDCLVHAIGVNCRKREVYSLWDLVKEIGEKEKGLLTTKILNELISLMWKLRKGKAALQVFDKFDEFGCKHDSDSYYLTLEALFVRSLFDSASSVCEKMLDSGELPSKLGKIIVGLCKGSKARDAHAVYLMAKEKEQDFLPKSSVNFLVNTLAGDNETVHLAAELLEDIKAKSGKHATKPFTSVIRGLCRKQDVKEAKKLLFKMIDDGPPPGNAAFNFVVTGLSKAGDMDEAIAVMKTMESRGLRPDLYTYSVIMSGFANGGQMDDASRIFSEAKKTHSKLCPVIFHSLIRGYCKIEEFDEALKYLGEMEDGGVKPSADEYNKLIQSLCLKAMDWRTAEKLLEEMKEKGLYLNATTRSLIRAIKEMQLEAIKELEGEEVLQLEAIKELERDEAQLEAIKE